MEESSNEFIRKIAKTTLVKSLKGDYNYFSLENPDTRLFAESDPRGFLSSAGKKFILDEVQYVPELFSYLQDILDSSGENGKVILPGSQSFLMNQHISQSLAGRVQGRANASNFCFPVQRSL